MKLIGRIFLPTTVFVVFLLALLNRQELVDQFLVNADFLTRNLFTYGVQVGVWLSAAFLLNRIISVFFWDGFIARISGQRVPRLPKDVTGIILFVLAGLAITSTVFHQDIRGILATSGIVGVIIGLALRTVILDLFMGLAIHVERPFKIGDWVMIHQNRVETHITAEVIEINWRTTRLRTTRNNMVVVPNSKLGATIVTNYMAPKPHFRIDLDFTIDFEVPPDRAVRVLTSGVKAAADGEAILEDPEPEVRMKESTLQGMEYEVRFFILPRHISPNEARHVVNRSVLEHLAHSGIMPSHSKEEVFLARRERRMLDSSLDEDLYQLLTRTELFRSLSAKEFKEVFPKMRKRNLAEGEELYRQGAEGQSMFVCLEGLLTSSVAVHGEEDVKVEAYRAGQHFGEGNILNDTDRVCTVVANTDVLVYEIDKDDLAPMLKKHATFQSQLEQAADDQIEKIKKQKKAARKKRESTPKPEKKSSVKSAIQTFFTGFFDQTGEEENKK